MSASGPEYDARAVDIKVTQQELIVRLADDRTVAVPLRWFPRLVKASGAQRGNWELLANGQGIRWPDIDEDLSVAGLLRGGDSREGSAQL